MRPRNSIILLVCLLAGVAVSAQTAYVLTTSPTSVQDVCQRHGLDNKNPVWSNSTTAVNVVADPANRLVSSVVTDVDSDAYVVTFEPNLKVGLAELSGAASTQLAQSTVALLDTYTKSTIISYFGGSVLSSYVQQPATSILRLSQAQATFGLTGVATVAVIDTGVDPNHAVLASVLVPGFDFTRNVAGIPSEMLDLDSTTSTTLTQSTVALLDSPQMVGVNPYSVALLDQSTVALLDQSTVALLDQSTVALLDTPLPAAFGHGTMTAGLVHLVAPTARIMPLKAFKADGTSDIANIVRAVYYAVDHGANVISMSFELNTQSPALKAALSYAASRGVISVASSGNDASSVQVWPASLSSVIGIGSTSNTDVRSVFSNYGSPDVMYAAPGEGVITTFPGNNYAAAWGTSFSTPLAAGAAALVLQRNAAGGSSYVRNAFDKSAVPVQYMGKGRLDIYQALMNAN